MEKRKLGSTEVELSSIGLGTWALGGGGWKFGWGPQDDKESVAVIGRAVELGVNWIDTSPLYGLGHAEKIIGRALREMNEKPFVATKFGIVWDEKRRMAHRLQKQSVRTELEASLRRLRLETVDLYQMHWPIPDEGIEEAWESAAELLREGKARYIGVCNFSVDQLARIQAIHKPASVQLPYSVINRMIENETLPFCTKEGIGALAYAVLEKGLLAGKFTKETIDSLPIDDHRRRDPAFKEPKLSMILKMASELKSDSSQQGRTAAQIAIAKVLDNRAVCSAIIGARTLSQIDENAQGT